MDKPRNVLAGNDLSPVEIKEKIRKNAPNIKKIMFGFQVSGGNTSDRISVLYLWRRLKKVLVRSEKDDV